MNGCGVEGSLGGAVARGPRPGRPGGDPLTATDVLEIVSTEETCPERTVCNPTPVGGTTAQGDFVLRGLLPGCATPPGLVMMTDGQDFALHMSMTGAGGNSCPGAAVGAQNDNIRLGPALGLFLPTVALPSPTNQVPPNLPVVFFYAGRVVRYRIAPSNDPLDTEPRPLAQPQRVVAGSDGNVKAEPGGFHASPGRLRPWELVARGIEDLQIEYMGGDGLWRNSPPTSVANVWDTLVRQVRITLSARASAPNLQGAQTAGGVGPDAVRGQLVTVVTPRAAFNELQMCLAYSPPCPQTSHVQ